MDEYEFRFADAEDAVIIDNLLSENGLCHEDITNFLPDFIVAERNGDLVGVIGLEPAGDSGLLRSLAVVEPERGKGLGSILVDKLISHSRSKQVEWLYLLTDTAERFFARKGFKRISRDAVPGPIEETIEFASLCPADSVCMMKRINKTTSGSTKK